MNQPLVSVITPVLNGQNTIETHLKSIRDQTYKNIEHIIVDNYSTDKTYEICNMFDVKFTQYGPERVDQDNYGVQVSNGEYVFITGADMYVDPTYIEECVNECEQYHYDAIYASVLSRETNYLSRVKGLERKMYIGDSTHEASRFFKKNVFVDLGMYDTNLKLHGDDYDMQRKLDDNGYKTGRIKAREVHLDEIEDWGEVFLKSFYYGYNSLEYIIKYKKSAIVQLSPIKSTYFKPSILINNISLLPGFVAFKLVQYTSATIGLLCAVFRLTSIEKLFHTAIYKRKNRWKKDVR